MGTNQLQCITHREAAAPSLLRTGMNDDSPWIRHQKCSANSYITALARSLCWPKQGNSINRSLCVCVFVSLQSFPMHPFNPAISTHWSQVQSQNRLKPISLSLSSWPAYTVLLWPTLIESFYRLTGKGHQSYQLHTHLRTHTHIQGAFSTAHSFTPTRSGWKLSEVPPGALNCVELMYGTKRRNLKIRLVGNKRQADFMWLWVWWHKVRQRS